MKGLTLPKKKTFFAQASVLKRLIAFIIDLLIINMVILFPFRKVFKKIVPDTQSFSKTFDFLSNNSDYNTSITIILLVIAFLTLLYFMILEKNLKQTPGKMLFNLYVNSQTKDLKYWQLFVRSMFLIPLFPFNGLNFAMGLTKIRLRDYVVGTFLGIIPGTMIFANIGSASLNFKSPQFIIAIILLLSLMAVLPIYNYVQKKKSKKRK